MTNIPLVFRPQLESLEMNMRANGDNYLNHFNFAYEMNNFLFMISLYHVPRWNSTEQTFPVLFSKQSVHPEKKKLLKTKSILFRPMSMSLGRHNVMILRCPETNVSFWIKQRSEKLPCTNITSRPSFSDKKLYVSSLNLHLILEFCSMRLILYLAVIDRLLMELSEWP